MATPTPKSDDINSAINALTGNDRVEDIKDNRCTMCSGDANKFTDALSEKEYRISGMCQRCQDKVFGA